MGPRRDDLDGRGDDGVSELFGREDGPELVSAPKSIAYVGEPGPDLVRLPEGASVFPTNTPGDRADYMSEVRVRLIVGEELAKMKEHLVQDIARQIRMSAGTRHQ